LIPIIPQLGREKPVFWEDSNRPVTSGIQKECYRQACG
jgi:hypothetical protein